MDKFTSDCQMVNNVIGRMGRNQGWVYLYSCATKGWLDPVFTEKTMRRIAGEQFDLTEKVSNISKEDCVNRIVDRFKVIIKVSGDNPVSQSARDHHARLMVSR